MQKYYVEQHLADSSFDKKDFYSVIIIVTLAVAIAFFFKINSNKQHVKVIEPYYVEKFYKVPSKKSRFADKEYEIAVTKLKLDDNLRALKYRVKDLNKSLNSFQSDLLKQQAMNDIILMLQQVKKGNLENFDINKMQQAVLEAGYGNVDARLLQKAIDDYQTQIQQEKALEQKIADERRKTQEKIQRDSEDAAVLASDIAKEIAEDEIENFIDNLSMIARVGHFVVRKVSEE
jgi:hypothetical protein